MELVNIMYYSCSVENHSLLMIHGVLSELRDSDVLASNLDWAAASEPDSWRYRGT